MLPTYNSFAEKEENFQIERIEQIAEFIALKEALKQSNGIFRGINNAAYKIYTSLQRRMLLGSLEQTFSMDAYIQNFREMDAMQRYFRAYNYSPSKLGILSFLQHHGAPTPLLDFTSNLDVALFFAIEDLMQKGYVASSNDIENYFSIFQIPQSKLELLDVKRVFEDLERHKKAFVDSWGKQDENAILYINHIDQLASINTMDVYLIDFANNYPAFNVQNSIRILNQEGLFIYNNFGVVPLEVALKKFFIPATQYVGSQLDEIDDPQIIANNEQYRKDLERNCVKQSELEENIIISYEIHKSLIPEIIKMGIIDRSVIYPDFVALSDEAFKKTNR